LEGGGGGGRTLREDGGGEHTEGRGKFRVSGGREDLKGGGSGRRRIYWSRGGWRGLRRGGPTKKSGGGEEVGVDYGEPQERSEGKEELRDRPRARVDQPLGTSEILRRKILSREKERKGKWGSM
jgi:hypothetical protein